MKVKLLLETGRPRPSNSLKKELHSIRALPGACERTKNLTADIQKKKAHYTELIKKISQNNAVTAYNSSNHSDKFYYIRLTKVESHQLICRECYILVQCILSLSLPPPPFSFLFA